MTATTRPLKRYCVGPPEYGLNIPAGEYSGKGIRFLRTTDIGVQGGLSEGDGVFVPEQLALDPRHQLLPGDLLFSRSGSLGRCLRFEARHGPATFAGYLVRFRPGPEAEPRFLEYCAQSKPFQSAIEADAITSTISNFNAERYASIEMPDVSLDEQRAIADYLDAETARIDALIAKKQQLIHLLEERQKIEVETVIRRLGREHGLGPLKRFAGPITVGIVITPAKWYVERGVPAVRGLNVSAGHIDMSEVVFLSDEGHQENAKSTLTAGDVVVVRTGQAGAAAVVPTELDGANCIDLLIVRRAEKVRSRFLEYVLNSDWTAKHIGEHSVGSIQAHFNVAALREVPVPVPPIEVQDQLLDYLDRISERHRRTDTRLARQLGLLVEHRQALIVSAVTGEFQVPGAA